MHGSMHAAVAGDHLSTTVIYGRKLFIKFAPEKQNFNDPFIVRFHRSFNCSFVLKPILQNFFTMEQHAFKNVYNCLNSNIYSYSETSGGQSYNLY